MFYRGQKVVVTESSAKKGAHPAIGDIGYIENMFLFPAERFILISLIMCSYSGKKNDVRSEHRKFIIDLGMHNDIKSKIASGVNKLFFLSKNYVNLLPSFIYKNKMYNNDGAKYGSRYDCMITFPLMVGTYGVWSGYTRMKGRVNPSVDNNTIIPYGHIKACNCKHTIHNMPALEMKSWIRSLSANIAAIVYLFGIINKEDGGGNLIGKSISLYDDIKNIFTVNERRDSISYLTIRDIKALEELRNYTIPYIVGPIMKLNVMLYTAMTRLFTKAINNGVLNGHNSSIRSYLYSNDVRDLLNFKVMSDAGIRMLESKLVGEYLFRALFIGKDTKTLLSHLEDYLPKEWHTDLIVQLADTIKSDVNSGSAALNRLFDIFTAIDPHRGRLTYDYDNKGFPKVSIGKSGRLPELPIRLDIHKVQSGLVFKKPSKNKVIREEDDERWPPAFGPDIEDEPIAEETGR